ncbi:hypothetical protein T439DRAFT_320574 [Meredithblackwellia eburnea MCA 4105]
MPAPLVIPPQPAFSFPSNPSGGSTSNGNNPPTPFFPNNPPALLPAPPLNTGGASGAAGTGTTRHKRALDPIEELSTEGHDVGGGTLSGMPSLARASGHRRTMSLGRGFQEGLGLAGVEDQEGSGGFSDDEGLPARRAAKRVRLVDVEPAFANLSIATPLAPPRPHSSHVAPVIFTSSSSPPRSTYAPLIDPPPLQPIPTGLAPLPFNKNNDPDVLPVTPPMQQGESHGAASLDFGHPLGVPPPLIRTHRPTPTPTPSPPAINHHQHPQFTIGTVMEEDSKMSSDSSYEIAPNVVYVSSLDDSDDELEDDREVGKAGLHGLVDSDSQGGTGDVSRIELHPSFLAATSSSKGLPSPLPPELLKHHRPTEEMGLVLYRPLTFPAEKEAVAKKEQDYQEYQRERAKEEARHDELAEGLKEGVEEGDAMEID